VRIIFNVFVPENFFEIAIEKFAKIILFPTFAIPSTKGKFFNTPL